MLYSNMIRKRYRAIKNYSFILFVNLLHKYKNFQSYQGSMPLNKLYLGCRVINSSNTGLTPYINIRANM
jgi:hypothetical protein